MRTSRRCPCFASRRQQRGQYIIGALLALVVAAMLLAGWARIESRRSANTFANLQGAALAQYAAGLRGYIAAVQGNPGLIQAQQIGVDWLKGPGCGGLASNPAAGYVPCEFTGGPFGRHFVTTTTANGDLITVATTFNVRPDSGVPTTAAYSPAVFAAAIAKQALASAAVSQIDAVGAPPYGAPFVEVYSNAPATAPFAQPDPGAVAPANEGNVVLVASNASSQDIWLRVDGKNKMLADLNMGGQSIVNARDGTFTGDLRARDMDMSRNATIRGKLQIGGTGSLSDTLNVYGTASVTGVVTAKDVCLNGSGPCVSRGVYDVTSHTATGPFAVAKPTCPAGGTPTMAAFYESLGQLASGYAINGSRIDFNVNQPGATWTVTPTISGYQYTSTNVTVQGPVDPNSGWATLSGSANLNQVPISTFSVAPVIGVITKCM